MKFGKTIQSQQVPGWGDYYLNYKASSTVPRHLVQGTKFKLTRQALKKIINSYAAGRSAADASLLSLGLRPPKRSLSTSASTSERPDSSGSSSTTQRERLQPTDLDPLPPETEPPAGNSRSGSLSGETNERGRSFKAHRDVFFFTLQRELEKINAFYLIKERDLRLRLLTLLTNRKRLLHHQPQGFESDSGAASDEGFGGGTARRGVEWTSLEEAWRLFERDLGKLQGFIEINATGFRKILKKWDKRSKSNTQEMYLERQVEVQPCFNREFIAKLSDIVAANLLDLENGSDHLSADTRMFADLPESISDRRVDFDADAGQALAADTLVDLEASLEKALVSGREAITDWLKVARARQQRGKDRRVMRILWRAALSVQEQDLDLVLHAGNLDFDAVDNINGRSPLHQACIAGSARLVRLCVETVPTLLERTDAYDRRPLHYAAMHGHAEIVSYLLTSTAAQSSPTDMDGYTPLMHAITQGHLDVVRIFVSGRINMEPTKISNDLIPLSLACQYGHLEVARLLLESGAKVLPNSEGLYPQHFAAKAGHDRICQLLVDAGGADGGGKNRQDKYNLWTPLHHAAVGGEERHLACIRVLVAAGCDVNASDEYGKSPGWYAAWFGHVDILNFLLDSGAKLSGKGHTLEGMETLGLAADPQMDALSPGSDVELDRQQGAGMEEFELIPSLSLPPPIIPLRVYGHEFLAQRCLVQLSLGHPFSRSTKHKIPPVKLYSRSGTDSLHLWSSLKLVMTSKSDISAVPHSVILPLPDEREVFSFQVQSLERFTLELSLYPTFGSKVIGRSIILPSTFMDIRYHKGFVAPLLDHHLKTIGEVAFEVSCIRPFEGAQLEIGGRVETYWKSKVTPSTPTQDHAHQYAAHRPLSVSTPAAGSPSRPPAVAPTSAPPRESALVTASSLSGEYVHVTVQVTKDGIPVAYPEWRLPIPGLDVGVADVTHEQFLGLAKSLNRELAPPPPSPSSSSSANGSANATAWSKAIAQSLVPLDSLLASLPSSLGINVQLRYVRELDSARLKVGRSIEVNEFVDRVLGGIYDAGRNELGGDQAAERTSAQGQGRKIVFSSFEPTVCTALNWKQPNYAVFFASYCGISRKRQARALQQAPAEEESDLRCLSVREAVNFAKSTNLLGVILDATTLAAVPSLVASVKDAGLLLAAFGDPGHINSLRTGGVDGRTIDAHVDGGIMTLSV